MFRQLAALTAIAIAATSFSSSVVNARPMAVDAVVDSGGRRLIGLDACVECVPLCKEVHYKALCRTLTKLPRVKTPLQLLEAAVRVAAAESAMAEMRLDKALKSPAARDTAMASSLESCRDAYGSLVDSLRSTWGMLRTGRGRRDDIMTEMSAASTFSTDCQDIFDERPELRSPIAGAQRHITRLVNNCLDLAATIKLP